MVDYKKKYLKYKKKYLQAKKNIKIKGGNPNHDDGLKRVMSAPETDKERVDAAMERPKTDVPNLGVEEHPWLHRTQSGPLSSPQVRPKTVVPNLGAKEHPMLRRTQSGPLSSPQASKKISIASYNISWATQLNDAPWFASEADFVTECQRRYPGEGGKKCFDNAIKSIEEAINDHNIKLIGFQEVAPTGDSSKKLETFSKGLKWAFYHRTYTDTRKMGDDKKPVTTALVSMWDPTIFGNIVEGKIFNLTEDDKDNRPCTIIITDNTIIINAHFGWIEEKKDIEPFQKKINDKLNENLGETLTKIKHIIFVGDTNDANGLINSKNPLVLNGVNFEFKLHNDLTQEDTKEKLRTCCWHAPGHKYYQENKSPGDYAIIMKIKKNEDNKFETDSLKPTHHIIETERPQPPPVDLKSDHDPIITTVEI